MLSRVLSGRYLAVNERDKTIGQACSTDNYRFLSYQSFKSKKRTGDGARLGKCLPDTQSPRYHIKSGVEVHVPNPSA